MTGRQGGRSPAPAGSPTDRTAEASTASAPWRLARYHGLGNDYLVSAGGPALTPALARAVCDRHTGVGGDGVLEVHGPAVAQAQGAALAVTIWNPDGSVAEKSGNGLRILARWAADVGRVRPGEDFVVTTGPEVVRCRVLPQARSAAADGPQGTERGAVGPDEVVVSMGRASLQPERLGLVADAPWVGAPVALTPDGPTLPVVAISVGNPHAVLFTDTLPPPWHGRPLDDLPWRAWGEALEHHAAFRHRTNVQVAHVQAPASGEARSDGGGTVAIRIWERGAGPTLASGSSSCAVAAAAVHTGRLRPGPVAVHMPGGVLSVQVSETLDLELRGAVEAVGVVVLDARWVAARIGG